MDQPRPIADRLGLLLVAGSAALLIGAAADSVRLRGERWLAPGMRVAALTTQPRECLDPAADTKLVAIGRAAFRDPLLLGGQGARAQLSCATCHPSGRANPAFLLPELSDKPGTADVTSSLMSSHRGNGVFDPKPIPDLTAPGKVSRDPASPALATFVHGLITEEFDGNEPPPVAFKGLLAYLRALRACRPDAREPITVDAAIADTEAAMHAADDALSLGDRSAARLMIGAARMTLGSIDERYDLPAVGRAALPAADRRLLALQLALDRGENLAPRLAAWLFPQALAERLRRDAPRSLYDPAVLASCDQELRRPRRAERPAPPVEFVEQRPQPPVLDLARVEQSPSRNLAAPCRCTAELSGAMPSAAVTSRNCSTDRAPPIPPCATNATGFLAHSA